MSVRVAAAIAVLAVALPVALVVHRHVTVRTTSTVQPCHPLGTDLMFTFCPGVKDVRHATFTTTTVVRRRPSWDDPGALAVAILGFSAAAAIAVSGLGRRRSGGGPRSDGEMRSAAIARALPRDAE